jgi:hypothetical protein
LFAPGDGAHSNDGKGETCGGRGMSLRCNVGGRLCCVSEAEPYGRYVGEKGVAKGPGPGECGTGGKKSASQLGKSAIDKMAILPIC